VERIGIDKIRTILLEDNDYTAGLDAAIQAAVDAFKDPWLEAAVPATASQFVSTLPMVTA